jgi:hypothetical protein
MRRLRAKYACEPDYAVPRIVFLDRSSELASERQYFEGLVQSAPQQVQRGWVSRLVSSDPAQHFGAWFEVMLYGWLLQLGRVVVEPRLAGSRPDFLLSTAGEAIVVEARACLISEAERQRNKLEAKVISRLSEVRLPYVLIIEKLVLREDIDADAMTSELSAWLRTNSPQPFRYRDTQGSEIMLTARRYPCLDTVETTGPTRTVWASHEPLKRPLREKARQHRGLRKEGYPYVIAVFLESWKFTAEEVAEAWFGETMVTVDIETKRVVRTQLDGTGLHFFGSEVRHRTVSGTLVFRAVLNEAAKRHELKPWYIQNPFGKRRIEPNLFPAESRYIVTEEKAAHLSMAWESASRELSSINQED